MPRVGKGRSVEGRVNSYQTLFPQNRTKPLFRPFPVSFQKRIFLGMHSSSASQMHGNEGVMVFNFQLAKHVMIARGWRHFHMPIVRRHISGAETACKGKMW
jgi:hypothetical protein